MMLLYIMKRIHTIGDSHSNFSGLSIQHHLGPVLCYSFGRDKLNRCDIRYFNLVDGDSIVFCFGEIDCRCHIYKHVTTDVSYQSIIDNIVGNYFDAIKANLDVLQVKLNKVCVYNVVPPVERRNTLENPEYPYLGTDEERKEYVLYFNKKLGEKCMEYGYLFMDVYAKYVDENGYLSKELSDGNVHIGNHVYVMEFILENIYHS